MLRNLTQGKDEVHRKDMHEDCCFLSLGVINERQDNGTVKIILHGSMYKHDCKNKIPMIRQCDCN